jgi:DNA modification methylase
VWDKGDAGTVGDLVSGYGYNYELIVYAMKGSRPLARPRPRALFRYDWSASNDPVHPARKPLGLFIPIIQRSSLPREMILDPFCGTAPVAEAAMMTGRKFIGVEMVESYLETAAQRLSQGVLFTL